jgi:hypothetical protein
MEMAGQQSPIYQAPDEYILPIKRCIEGFRREDPPAVPQLAVPIAVPKEAYRFGYLTSNVRLQAQGDLALIAFFYLLRSGEYTKPKKFRQNGAWKRATRTRQFRVCDIGFFKQGKILPRSSPLATLLTADAATMKISNQKNGRMGQTIHQEATGLDGGVAALARRVHHILSNGGADTATICEIFDGKCWSSVTSQDMVHTVRTAAQRLRLEQQGIDPDVIGAHSLRAGGGPWLSN